jgi:hypothetical protein
MEKLVKEKPFSLSAPETQRAGELKKLNDALANLREKNTKPDQPENK